MNNSDIEFLYSLSSTSQKRIRFLTTAMVCDWYNVFDKAAASITSAVLKDLGIISEVDSSQYS